LENDGENYQEIANLLGIAARKLAYWATNGSPNNIETLEDKRRKGHHQKATEEYIKILIDLVDKAPEELGYEERPMDRRKIIRTSVESYRNKI
jgi:transposase